MSHKSRTVDLNWSGPRSVGIKVPTNPIAADAVRLIARRMASAHYEENQKGLGVTIAHHLEESDPKTWARFMSEAMALIISLSGSGEKDMACVGVNDDMSYFTALGELAHHMRHERG